ncbi:hypothetical protein [Rheinheimera pacifica]|uniref:hypothetical protein n=1 Tax=Rheinheimera pacifica TaxID=173990 RepID=UPI002EDB4E30
MNWKLCKKISLVLIAALALAVVADILIFLTVEYGSKGSNFVGCYAYDAMLIGFECKGFWGSNVVTAWLNWPLWLIYAPISAVFSIRALIIAVLVWFPILLFAFSDKKLSEHKNA